MPVRRAADPINVQHVWDAIRHLSNIRQVSDFSKITKTIQRFSNSSQIQAELFIRQTIQDGLIIVDVRKNSIKLATNANEPESCKSYKINKHEDLETPTDDGFDWYCIECHLGGDVTPCKSCYRVFHAECSTNARRRQSMFPKLHPLTKSAKNETAVVEPEAGVSLATDHVASTNADADDYIYDELICSMCNMAAADPGTGLELAEFNHLLSFIFHRIKSWVPERLTTKLEIAKAMEWHTQIELRWRSGQLFYQHVDMSLVELKIRTKEYSKFSQFQSDIITMQHNLAIFHGVESQEYGAGELMMLDTKHDISEIQNCVDCYKHSNEKINDKWFCFPCRIAHTLVWAKQTGYPHWPAKIMRVAGTNYDVRFFGGKYERSLLPKTCIKPINTNLSLLQIKRSATFNKAMEELKLHQKLLENPVEFAKIYAIVEPKKRRSRQSISPIKAAANSRKKSVLAAIKPPLKEEINGKAMTSTSRRSKVTRSSFIESLPKTEKKEVANGEVFDVYDFDSSFGAAPTSSKIQSGRNSGGGGGGGSRKRSSLSTQASGSNSKKRSTGPPETSPDKLMKAPKKDTPDVINLSDLEDSKVPALQYNLTNPGFAVFTDNQNEPVTSSTEYVRNADDSFGSTDGAMHKLDHPYSDAVEKMRRKLEQTKDNKQVIAVAMDCMQLETDRITNENNESLKRLFETHNAQLSETKKKQWCYNCEQDAIYHCCWNTAYCSPTCQQQHWQAEHKKVCRRKR